MNKMQMSIKNRIKCMSISLFEVLGSRFWVQGSEVQGSRFSPAAGRGGPVKTKNETLKKRITNIEQGIMNVEVRYSNDLN
jgi:hypothetical protein